MSTEIEQIVEINNKNNTKKSMIPKLNLGKNTGVSNNEEK